MSNPYSLMFGIEPKEYISRITQKETIVSSLEEGIQRLYMITGVRGSGKTVFMSEIKSYFNKKSEWETVELSTERNMLDSLVKKMSADDRLKSMLQNAKLSLNFPGVGIELSGPETIADAEIALSRILEVLKKNNKKLLVFVDEAVDNGFVREFASVFQLLIRDDLPLNLVMTGLYENIDDLQNEKNLTSLHRAPKLHMGPLSIGTMAANYRKNLNIDDEESIKLAQLTRGYSYAFQVLGYAMKENNCDYDQSVIMLKQYLEEYVYDKIWSELSEKDKKILYAITKTEKGKVLDIRKYLGIESNEFTPYKKRLIRKGVISDETGYARLTLPLFDEFIKENYY